MFAFPPHTVFARNVPKTRILAAAGRAPGLKDALAKQVDKIIWQHKLAPSTLRLPAARGVLEVHVFEIHMKGGELDGHILDQLDRTIPHPILFHLLRADGARAWSAALKRPSEAAGGRFVTGVRRGTDFAPPAASPPPLPTAIDMAHLYAALLAPLMPAAIQPGETLAAWEERCKAIDVTRRKITRLESRLSRERQFNRKVEINREIKALQEKLKS